MIGPQLFVVVLMERGNVDRVLSQERPLEWAANAAANYNTLCRETDRWAAVVPFPVSSAIYDCHSPKCIK